MSMDKKKKFELGESARRLIRHWEKDGEIITITDRKTGEIVYQTAEKEKDT